MLESDKQATPSKEETTINSLLIINPNGGTARRGNQLEKLQAACQEIAGLSVHLLQPEDDLKKVVQTAIKNGAQVIGAAGGDGTINAVASQLVGTETPLVVIPFGTLNHFARDLNIQSDPIKALELFDLTRSQEQTIDVGSVGGLYFLNNSSVGLYPRLVKQREKYEKILGKWVAYAFASWQVARHPQLLRLRLETDTNQTLDLKVSLLFIANNQAEMYPLNAGRRERLDEHILDVYVVRASSVLDIFKIATDFLRGQLENSPMIERIKACEVTVYVRNRRPLVARDGEVSRLSTQLRYKTVPNALKVRVPLPENS